MIGMTTTIVIGMIPTTIIGITAVSCGLGRFRGPQRRVKTEVDQLARIAGVGLQPSGDVLGAGKLHDADGGGRAVERLRRGQRLFAAGLVVVFKYENVAAAQHFDKVGCPLAAAGERGRAVSQRGDAVGVLLALADEHRAVRVGQELWQPVEHAAHVAELVGPAAVAVRLALGEALRLVPLHLVEQRAALVVVVVARHHRRPGGRLLSQDRGHDGLVDVGVGGALVTVAVGFPRGEAGLLAHVVAADDRIVAGEAVHHEAVGCSGVYPDRQRSVRGAVAGTRRQHLVVVDDAAERARQRLQAQRRGDRFPQVNRSGCTGPSPTNDGPAS
jgi:hypothetical protein